MLKKLSRVTVVTASLFALSAMPIEVSAADKSDLGISSSSRKKIVRLAKRGLSRLPSATTALKAKRRRSNSSGVYDVSGTPPTLLSIAASPIKNIYWANGLVDAINNGDPSPEQCNTFFSGMSEGESSGMVGCYMSQNVGEAFGNINQTSACYMKNLPTQENIDAGGVEVLSGNLPGGRIEDIFNPPAGDTARLVKINVSGFVEGEDEEDEGSGPETVMIRVHSAANNRSAGNAYNAELFFCNGENSEPNGYNQLRVTNTGRYLTKLEEQGGGGGEESSMSGLITGTLVVENGRLKFDTTKARDAEVNYFSENGSFKGDIRIAANNVISMKNFSEFGSFGRKSFSKVRFSGTTPETIRFLEGAANEMHIREDDSSDTFLGAMAWQDNFYAADPENQFLSDVGGEDFESEFYTEPYVGDLDIPAFNCLQEPDIEISADMSNETVLAATAECEERPFNGMRFCQEDEDVNAAFNNFFSYCF